MVELTAFTAYVNPAARASMANGVTSQGFSDACQIPPAGRPATSRVGSWQWPGTRSPRTAAPAVHRRLRDAVCPSSV